MVETLQRPVAGNGSAKTRVRSVERRLEAAKTKEVPKRVEIRPLVAEQRNRAIVEKVRAALRSSPYYVIRHVSCEVCDCVLILRGRVSSFYMKQMAQTIVRHQLDGSLVLDNQLEVDCT